MTGKKKIFSITQPRYTTSGFTLVELLIMVAVIAILASVAVTRFSTFQQKNRDAKRVSDVSEIKKALSLYRINAGTFPIETTGVIITGNDSVSTILEGMGVISATPSDPQHPGSVYTYKSNASGSDYDISFCLETDTISNYSQGCGNTIGP